MDNDTDYNEKYFKASFWGLAFELLNNFLRNSNDISLVVGESGLGKTTLKQALLDNKHEFMYYCDLDCNNYNDQNVFFQDLQNELQLSKTDKKVRVLFVDNAEILEDEILIKIFTIFKDISTVKLLLFGKLSLEEEINKVRIKLTKDNNLNIIQLEEFTLNETAMFVGFYWKLMNNNMEFPFGDTELTQIYNYSCGNPAKIINLLNNYLQHGKFIVRKFKFPTVSRSQIKILQRTVFVSVLLILGISFGKVATSYLPLLIQHRSPKNIVLKLKPNFQTKKINLDNFLIDEPMPELVDAKDMQLGWQEPPKPPKPPIIVTNENQAGLENNLQIFENENIDEEEKQVLEEIKPTESEVAVIEQKNYTLQLMTSSDLKGIKNFITKNKLTGPAHYYNSVNNKKIGIFYYMVNMQPKNKPLQQWLNYQRSFKHCVHW